MGCGTTLSVVSGQLLVTSTSRPTGKDLYAGLRIYELDTSRELTYDGTNWVIMSEPDQLFTPVLTGMVIGTGGNALNQMHYHRQDGYLDFEWNFVFGTAGATFPTNPSFSLPVALASVEFIAPATFVDAGVNRYNGFAETSGLSSLVLVTFAAATTNISTTTPFTWGAGDYGIVRGRYRMTTRYS